MPLTDTAIQNAKPREKTFKLFDARGLLLLVTPAGRKWWRLKYRFDNKEKQLSLGVYPEVSLKNARLRRDDAYKLLAAGIDPSEERKKERKIEHALTQDGIERRKADRINAALSMRLVIFPDGMHEAWRGRKLIARLSASQAHELCDLLNNTTGG